MNCATNPRSASALVLRTSGLLVMLLLLSFYGESPAVAQSGPIVWSPHTNLSNSPQASAHPAIVADDYGLVHVFWSEEVGGKPVTPGEGIRNTGNSIFYTRWDGQSWSAPLDILFVPHEVRAEWPVATIDAENKLHVLWESYTTVYYSSAPSWDADSAQNWSQPLLLTASSNSTPWGAGIAADVQGTLHVVYAAIGDEEGLNYTRSTDGGETWELPFRLYGPFAPSEEPPSMVQIVTDEAGRLHVVWQRNQVEGSGYGVYYARSTNGGETWDAPIQLADRDPEDFSVGTPYLIANGASELHLIYVDGAYTGSKGRFHRISRDGGASWGEPMLIIPELVGINGYVMPVLDGAGQMHLIANMRTEEEQAVGIYYARWLGTGWSPVTPIDVSIPQIHYTAVTVRLGNELHIVYNQLRGAEIWHIHGLVSQLTPQPTLALPTPTLPAQPTQTAAPTLSAVTLDIKTGAPPSPGETLSYQTTPLVFHPLVLAVVSALIIATGGITWKRLRSRW